MLNKRPIEACEGCWSFDATRNISSAYPRVKFCLPYHHSLNEATQKSTVISTPCQTIRTASVLATRATIVRKSVMQQSVPCKTIVTSSSMTNPQLTHISQQDPRFRQCYYYPGRRYKATFPTSRRHSMRQVELFEDNVFEASGRKKGRSNLSPLCRARSIQSVLQLDL